MAVFATGEPVMVNVESDAKAVSVVDAMGNAVKVDVAGRVRVEATAYLKTVVLEGATYVR